VVKEVKMTRPDSTGGSESADQFGGPEPPDAPDEFGGPDPLGTPDEFGGRKPG
jgi:hypothetical protein